MKHKYIALAIAAIGAVAAGCSDYLDRTPKDKNSDNTNWTSEGALETYAWKLYDNFPGYGKGWGRGQYLSEGMTDDYCADTYTQPTQSIPASSSKWTNGYKEIRRANVLLNRVGVVPNLPQEAANHWSGIARFFRAMKHFELVQTYGDVVWIDTEIDIDDAAALSKARSPRVEVMKKVCEDLQFAGENCRFTTDNTVNNMCAWALLSRAALFEASWQKYHAGSNENAIYFYEIAKRAAANVIASGKYNVHDNYLSNYISKSLVGNTEMILFKVYSFTGEGDRVTLAHSMQGWSSSSSKSWGLTKSAVESFAMDNGLPIHMGTYSDATLDDVVSNRDERLSMIIDPQVLCPVGMAYREGINSSTGYYTDKLVDWDDYGNSTWSAPNNTTDSPVFGYSEVLVNYAEACAELESLGAATMSQNDLDISVNLLRTRHGKIAPLTYAGKGAVSAGGTLITPDPKNTTGINTLLWELRRERRSELMCDGFRYNDLLRWKLGSLIDFNKNPECYMGARKSAMEAYYQQHKSDDLYKDKIFEDVIKDNFWDATGEYIAAYNLAQNIRVFDETRNYLEPIPSTQLNLNPNLKPQNPGW